MTKLILGLVGQMGSGKGTVAKYLIENYSATTHKFSDALRDILDRLGVEKSRENISLISGALRQTFGEEILTQSLCVELEKDQAEIVVLDGVRRAAEVEVLRQIPGFVLVWVETDLEKRYQRLVARGENTGDSQKTFEQFQKEHELETEKTILPLKELADFQINNDGELEDVYQQVEEVINKKLTKN